jgi:hypothetical protein
MHAYNAQWDVALDLVDVLGNDKRLGNYLRRIRFGSEYRVLNGAVALRGGLLDGWASVGVGASVWVLRFDFAAGYDRFVRGQTLFAQVKMGW